MTLKPMVVGIGHLVVDHHLRENGRGVLAYAGSRGGGSVCNILMNAATANAEIAVVAIVAAGQDWRAAVAKRDLANIHATINLLPYSDHRPTMSFWHVPDQRIAMPAGRSISYRTTSLCEACGTRPGKSDAAGLGRVPDVLRLLRGYQAVVVVDSLHAPIRAAVKQLGVDGAFTVLDFGRAGYLRSRAAMEILDWLGDFDLVVAQEKVIMPLVQSLRLRHPSAILNRVPIGALIVSGGPHGLTLYQGGWRNGQEHFPSSADSVLDDVGAGDAFLGRLLASLLVDSTDRMMHRSPVGPELRSATERAVVDMRPALQHLGARGHLTPPVSSDYPTARWVGLTIDQIRDDMPADKPCLFCGFQAS